MGEGGGRGGFSSQLFEFPHFKEFYTLIGDNQGGILITGEKTAPGSSSRRHFAGEMTRDDNGES